MKLTGVLAISAAATAATSFVLPAISSTYGVALTSVLIHAGLTSAYVVPPTVSLRKLQVRKAISVIIHRRQDETDPTTSLDANPTADPTASINPTTTEDPITSADPTATADPTVSSDPGATQDPITSADPSATQDPISSAEPVPTADPTGSSDQPAPGGGNSTLPHHCQHPGHGKPPPHHVPRHHKGNSTHHDCHPHKPGHGGHGGHNGTWQAVDMGANNGKATANDGQGQNSDGKKAFALDTTAKARNIDGNLVNDRNVDEVDVSNGKAVRLPRTEPGFSTSAGAVSGEDFSAGE